MSVRLYRLSWAASVVLALGTGWMLRGGQVVPIEPLARPAGPGEADGVGTRVVEEREVGAEAVPAAQQPTAEVVNVDAAGAVASSVEERLDAGAPAGAPSAPEPSPQVTPAPLVDANDFADAAAGAGGAVGAAGLAAGAAPAPAAAAPAQPTDARVAERLDSAARANQAERRVVAQDQVITSAISADAAAVQGRQQVANEVSTRDDEPVSLVVPGLETLAVLPVGEGTTFAGMRALQRLESGDTLELVHLPQGIDPSFLPPLRPGYSALVLPRGNGWLVMRAPVPERYLQELLQRLEGGR
jgi:hypothetical protein